MPNIWPTTVRAAQYRGSQYVKSPNVIRSSMEYGPAKVRRRATVPQQETFTLSWDDIPGSELVLWDDFFNGTLEGGTLAFQMAHPVTGDTVDVRVVEPVTFECWLGAADPDYARYKGTVKLEVV